jgi:GNAT superfamily N-acetyltransferase
MPSSSPESEAKLVIRPITDLDLDLLATRFPPPLADIYTDWLTQHLAGDVTWLVAAMESDIVGHGLLHWSGPRDPGIARRVPDGPEIFALSVHANYQSRGIGSALVRAFEELALRRGRAEIGLGVGLENLRAESLYLRLGYGPAGSPTYTDCWAWTDARGEIHREADECRYLVKRLVA